MRKPCRDCDLSPNRGSGAVCKWGCEAWRKWLLRKHNVPRRERVNGVESRYMPTDAKKYGVVWERLDGFSAEMDMSMVPGTFEDLTDYSILARFLRFIVHGVLKR